MLGFVLGAIAGGMVVYWWRDRIQDLVQDTARQTRSKAADGLHRVQQRAEEAIDSAKEQVTGGLRAGEEWMRSTGSGPGSESPR
jgi:hypothetical protein